MVYYYTRNQEYLGPHPSGGGGLDQLGAQQRTTCSYLSMVARQDGLDDSPSGLAERKAESATLRLRL